MQPQESHIYREVLQNIREGVYVTDTRRVITDWNQGAVGITGFPAEEILGRNCQDNLLVHVDDQGHPLCDGNCPLQIALEQGEEVELEVHLRHREGHRIPVHLRAAPIRDGDGAIIGACEVFSDISARMADARKIQELERLAMLDHLTQLANRRYMELTLRLKLEEVARAGTGVGVILYDIDRFKQVNDRHGHDVGDLVIQMVARTLQKSTRALDVAGRWGGEEFLEVVYNVTPRTLHHVAERNRMLVAQSQLPAPPGEEVVVTVSLGATMIHPQDTLATLLKRVDTLLYRSKEQGRNRVSMG